MEAFYGHEPWLGGLGEAGQHCQHAKWMSGDQMFQTMRYYRVSLRSTFNCNAIPVDGMKRVLLYFALLAKLMK